MSLNIGEKGSIKRWPSGRLNLDLYFCHLVLFLDVNFMHFPAVLKPFRQEGEHLLSEGRVGQIEFSGGTYQVQVFDDQYPEGVWTFLQLDDRNKLKDFFCSCDEGEMSTCPHLAASYLRIFNGMPQPLHRRFEKSLWNKLCFLYSQHTETNNTPFKPSNKGVYAIYSGDGRQIFLAHAKNKKSSKHLNDLLFHRHIETEETSLKFSNLTQDEIISWKEGRPSTHLRYELSFWCDLAKWLMSLQDSGENYAIQFEYSPDKIPDTINISFDQIECRFYISSTDLPAIIPALNTVTSPLKVHELTSQNITKITYDQEAGLFLIDSNKASAKGHDNDKEQNRKFGSWLYIPDKGFYPLDPLGLLSSKEIPASHISTVLNENATFVKEHLEGTVIHDEPITASYNLNFDDNWNLHINCYAFHPGDLKQPGSRYFGDWIYLVDTGFYKLEQPRFHDLDTIIPAEDVGVFIQQNRTWVNAHEGFETHLSNVEARLSYKMDSIQGPLSFQRSIATDEYQGKSKDFGPWVYIAGQGFYSKVTSHIGLPLRPGIALNADQIPLFIRTNHEELKLVHKFFSNTCPVIKVGLQITLNKDQIIVSPKYELDPRYKNKEVGYFDEFTYVPQEGFSVLPADCRLPLTFRHPVTITPEHLPHFINHELNTLKPFISDISKELERPSLLKLIAQNISRADANAKGWYTLELAYASNLGTIPLAKLWSEIKKKQRFSFSKAGLIDLEDRRFDWLKLLGKKRLNKNSNTLTLSTIELIRLNAFDQIEALNEESLHLLKELTDFQIPDEPDLTNLQCPLRPYQKIGLHWLWFLYDHGLSGLLCDDMGLGKTHQTMALLAAISNFHKKKGENVNRHFLIVCPTSVIYHWQDKLAQYLPHLRFCTFYGSERSLDQFHEQYDILLTSYGIWRIEHEMLSKIPFEVAVFDEIQVAKNHHSKLHSAVAHVNAQMRLGLTGTPIENRLRELKALFDLVLPTYMPSDRDFREHFVKPIEKDRDPARKNLLTRLIHPFVLRRKKEDVLIDLPDKTEEIAHCVLSEEQARMYNDVVEPSRRAVLAELANNETPIPFIHIFSILSALKQICNHPACYLKDPDSYKKMQSGKWNLFVELLNEARESNQKVVIFSQYLNMMDIIQNHLTEAGIGFASIRGSTTNRGEELKRFNDDPNCEVFVGSLQATGLGLELTAASVVIHYDRWWNAARENQATDRVHRIGQKRGVQVFKMVTKGTFEEKIDAMINRKGRLMDEIVGIDDHRILKLFNRDEIIELLQSVKIIPDSKDEE
jgi:SNF2 family DNA or RNA helicase